MTIRKLPSGNWNTQIMIKGKSHSITAPTKTEIRDKVAALIEREKNREENGCTVLEAITQYIDSKRNILSPSTIYSYQQIADFRLGSLRDIPVGKLTSLQIQQAINEESVKLTPKGTPTTPKTVKNIYGLLSASLKMVRPEFCPVVTLPKTVRTFRDLPEPELVIQAVKGTDIELPVLLAMWMSLTASEIRGIKVSSIKGNILTIDESVMRIDGEDVHKQRAKTYTRNRRIQIPDYIMDLIRQTDAWKAGEGYIEPRSGRSLYGKLQYRLGKHGIKMRFHDLRHLFASIGSQKLGIPEKTLMDIGGWATPNVMKSVYTHSFEQDRENNQKQIDAYFLRLLIQNSFKNMDQNMVN